MKTIRFSTNKKLQNALEGIYQQLCELGTDEVKHYKTSFPHEVDFNLAQYGSLLCYYSDIYDFYKDCGYLSTAKYSTDKIWDLYKRQVGYVARFYF